MKARTLRIRNLRESDVVTCARLVAATPLWQRYRYGVRRCATDLRAAIKRRDRVKVVDGGGSIDGLAWVLPRGGFGRLPYLKLLAVREGARGHGLGAALLHAVEGEGDLLLLVSDFNRSAQRFYARLGYRRAGALPELVLPGVTEILLWKRGVSTTAASRHPSDRPAAGSRGAAQSRAR